MEKIILRLYYQLALHVCIVSFYYYIYSIFFFDMCCFTTPVLCVLFLYKLSRETLQSTRKELACAPFTISRSCLHAACIMYAFPRAQRAWIQGPTLMWGGDLPSYADGRGSAAVGWPNISKCWAICRRYFHPDPSFSMRLLLQTRLTYSVRRRNCNHDGFQDWDRSAALRELRRSLMWRSLWSNRV